MKNFTKISDKITFGPLLDQVMCHDELWNSDKDWLREKQRSGSVLYAGQNIILRYIGVPLDEQNRKPFKILSRASQIVFDLMRQLEGVRLGNVVISKLSPGSFIEPHIDTLPMINPKMPCLGRAPLIYQRFQIPLQADHKVRFLCGDEVVNMMPGEAWWFDNQKVHSVHNDGTKDRISMFCDIRPS